MPQKLTPIPLEIVGFKEVEPGRLLGSLTFDGGYTQHVEAIRTTSDQDGLRAFSDDHEEIFDLLTELCGEGGFTTCEIPGHEGQWVIYNTPYC